MGFYGGFFQTTSEFFRNLIDLGPGMAIGGLADNLAWDREMREDEKFFNERDKRWEETKKAMKSWTQEEIDEYNERVDKDITDSIISMAKITNKREEESIVRKLKKGIPLTGYAKMYYDRHRDEFNGLPAAVDTVSELIKNESTSLDINDKSFPEDC